MLFNQKDTGRTSSENPLASFETHALGMNGQRIALRSIRMHGQQVELSYFELYVRSRKIARLLNQTASRPGSVMMIGAHALTSLALACLAGLYAGCQILPVRSLTGETRIRTLPPHIRPQDIKPGEMTDDGHWLPLRQLEHYAESHHPDALITNRILHGGLLSRHKNGQMSNWETSDITRHLLIANTTMDVHEKDIIWPQIDLDDASQIIAGLIAPLSQGITLIDAATLEPGVESYRLIEEEAVTIWASTSPKIHSTITADLDPCASYALGDLRKLIALDGSLPPAIRLWAQRKLQVTSSHSGGNRTRQQF